ncbi:MAG TPA: Ku protein [Nocardioidaceae bacterium]|nr:Ku protein [Nocardioidaceae bacterium]
MRSLWKGSVSFGLVSIPVKLYSATGGHDLRFHQVHEKDGGRIRYKRTCEVCGEVVAYSDIAKGFESDDGRSAILTDEDLDALPVASGREIDVVEFVPADQVDPMLMDKTYYLEPDGKAAKPYALLREALGSTERMALVKVALRQRETLAVLRVRDQVIVLQTLLWPDEVREPDFKVLDEDIDLRPQEVTMAESLVESLAADFDPTQFEDEYKIAMEQLVEAKLDGTDASELLRPDTAETGDDADVVDLVAALRASVEKAKGGRSSSGEKSADSAESGETGSASDGTQPAKKAPAKKTAAKKAPAKKTATTKQAAKKTAARKTAVRKSA